MKKTNNAQIYPPTALTVVPTASKSEAQEVREELGEVGSKPALSGRWRHSNGMIFCGTLRVAKSDFDTNPHPDFCACVFDDICRTMNDAQDHVALEMGELDPKVDPLQIGESGTRASGMVRERGGQWRYPTSEEKLKAEWVKGRVKPSGNHVKSLARTYPPLFQPHVE